MIESKDIINSFKNYTNTAISHAMTGYKYRYVECTCGYKSHIDKKTYLSHCPNCGCKVYIKDDMFFGEATHQHNISESFSLNDKDYYRFGILISSKSIKYKINFSKKILKDFRCENDSLLVFFDGYEKEEDKIMRFIDMNTEKEMTKEEFLSLSSTKEIVNLCHRNESRYKRFVNNSYSYMSIYTFMNILKSMMIDFISNPYYEILVKAGIDPYEISSGFNLTVNKEGKSPSEILGIKKYSLNKLKKYKTKYIPIREVEERLGSKMVQYYDIFVDDSNWSSDALCSDNVEKISYITKNTGISLSKLHEYIDSCYSKQYMYHYGESYILNLYYDSLIMAEQLEIPFDKTPRSLQRYHDVLTKECKLVEDEIKSRQIAEQMDKYNSLELISEKDEEGKFKNKYSIILPRSTGDVINEGKTMHHCVGSYVDRIIRGQSIILFLRKSDDINGRSVATFEVNPKNKRIVQIQAPYNQRPEQSAIEFIKKWCKKHEIDINRY